jgi:hypothetical protein
MNPIALSDRMEGEQPLCEIWDGADSTIRSAIKITRDGDGSSLAAWDVPLLQCHVALPTPMTRAVEPRHHSMSPTASWPRDYASTL